MKPSFDKLGKYRELALAAACFLLFDLGVLLLNFYTSYQIAAQAAEISIAGQQRMLSQNLSATLLTLQDEVRSNAPAERISALTNDLELGMAFFDQTLKAFRDGGTAHDANGDLVPVRALESSRGRDIIAEAERVWQGYFDTLSLVRDGNMLRENELGTAVWYAKQNNSKLLALMSELSMELQTAAARNAEWLRQVQTTGIMLALFNFVFILFKFIRRLREGDRQIEAAQEETGEILSTVREGLFLLDAKLNIGRQHSQSLAEILQHPVTPGADFMACLRSMVSPAVFEATEGYLELLFGNRVKESLVSSLNPLTEVEVIATNTRGETETRYLSFQFNRVRQGSTAPHLLVTVQDVTERVELRRELAQARQDARVEVDVLLRMLRTHPHTLGDYLGRAEAGLEQINTLLREASERSQGNPRDYARAVQQAFRITHAIKGEAAMLELDLIENEAHGFENHLAMLRERDDLSGDMLIELTVKLNELFERVGMMREITRQLNEIAAGSQVSRELLNGIETLAARMAQSQDKTVAVDAQLDALDLMPPEVAAEVRQIAIQLMRNAVTHGIESSDERREARKPDTGTIQIACLPETDGGYQLRIRDDGRGLSVERMRMALTATGKLDPTEITAMSEQELVMRIFDPGFSTAGTADMHAGRGVGLDVVLAKVRELGGKLKLSTRHGQYTEFSIRIPATQTE